MTSSGSGVWVFSERKDVVLELIGKGRELADRLPCDLGVLALGAPLAREAESFASCGADKVFVFEDPALQDGLPEPLAEAIGRLASQSTPDILLIGSTRKGKDVAARTAVRLSTGVMTDCMALTLDQETLLLVADRPSYGGIMTSTETCTTKPQMATIPPRAFEPATQGAAKGEVVRVEMTLTPPKTRSVRVVSKEGKAVSLEDASVIVSGGRGIAKKEDFAILKELAEVLGGEVGCSSPIAEDMKWMPLERLVGLTGRKVKPKLYIACGISGQAQHITGMRGARVVVAINTDPEAPIFQQSDYCVKGDLYEIVPQLTEAFRRIRRR